MTRLRFLAPFASQVAVKVGDRLVATRECGDSFWVTEADVPTGTDYAVVLDGAEPVPDPRSPFQPFGVHGPSRTVDHQLANWTDQGWHAPPLASAVIYELHIGTFSPGGTFDGTIEYLDHLVDLGISHVELMPVNEFPGARGWGYDGVDLYAPHHVYGGPDGLKRLVDACHRRGLAVVLDVVYNHLGPAGNYLGRFGPYFTDKYRTPWGPAVNLDGAGSDEVRRFFCENALMWLRDYHIDGLRIDAVHALIDMSAVHLLEQLTAEVTALALSLNRALVVIAESDLNDPRVVRAPAVGGYGVQAQWSDDFHHALHAVLTGERSGYYADFGALSDLAYALEHAFVYDGRISPARGRRHGRPADGISGSHFLGYLQTHDQVGNRARGERSSHLVRAEQLQIAAALVFTAPFVPMLFQGEEWGASTPFQYFTDHDDPQLAQAVSKGRREEFAAFGWEPADIPDPQSPETFDRSRLNWAERTHEPHRNLLEWHRELIAYRRATPALLNGRFGQVHYDEQARWLTMQRGATVTICNFGSEAQEVPLATAARGVLRLVSQAGAKTGSASIHMPGYSAAILELDPA